MNSDYTNFFALAVVELSVFYLLSLYRRLPFKASLILLIFGLLFGTPFGVCYDIFLGRYLHMFSYFQPPSNTFLILNALFAYGISSATAALIPIISQSRTRRSSRLEFYFLSGVILLTIVILLSVVSVSIHAVAAASFVMLAAEFISLICGHSGPLICLARRNPKPFFILWLHSTIIGISYELANRIWPLWNWHVIGHQNELIEFVIITVFGYLALFHPLAVAMNIIRIRIQPRINFPKVSDI